MWMVVRMKWMLARGRLSRHNRSVRSVASTLGLGIMLLSAVLSACGTNTSASAMAAKSRLDKELRTARTQLNVPEALLQPITAQEQSVAASTASGTDQAYQAAQAGYSRLYDQVVAIEHMAPDKAHARVQSDLQQFTAALQQVKDKKYIEAAQYEPRLQRAQQQFSAASSLKDYFTVDGYILAQTAAVQKIEPVYQQLQKLQEQVTAQSKTLGIVAATPQPLQCARGSSDSYFWTDPTVTVTPQGATTATYPYEQWPAQDLAQFRAASSAAQYDALTSLMTAQSQQLATEAALAAPAQAQKLVQDFQTDVQTYQQDGGKDTTYQQQAAQDAQTLTTAKTYSDYASLLQAVQKQRDALAFPLLKVQTQHDLATLQQLVNKAQSIKTIDPANGLPYPDGYEYAAGATGIGDAEARLANAQTQADYQAVDDEIQMFTTNLQAMLQNLNDKTPVNQPHQTDTALIQHYGISGTRVIVVSLREQEARMYDNGKFVKAIPVTTGNPDLPSPPGLHCIFYRISNYNDISPFPKSSPYYYNPTHINYGMFYSDYGYVVHDAWWRSWFGKYSNLPHYDPISFNNGSHGCVNLPLSDMAWLWQWSQMGTPVLVY